MVPDRPASPFFPFLSRQHSLNDQLNVLRAADGQGSDSSRASSPLKRRTVRWNRNKWSVSTLITPHSTVAVTTFFSLFFSWAPFWSGKFSTVFKQQADPPSFPCSVNRVKPTLRTVTMSTWTNKTSLSAILVPWPSTRTTSSATTPLTVSTPHLLISYPSCFACIRRD